MNDLINAIKKVNKLNYLSNDYKAPKSKFRKILDTYKKGKHICMDEKTEDFLLYVNGKMFFDWVVFKTDANIPVFSDHVGDVGLFYSLIDGMQYDIFPTMKSNNDLFREKDFLFAEATPGDYLAISFAEEEYGKIYFLSHDFNDEEESRYLVADSMMDFIGNMFVKDND